MRRIGIDVGGTNTDAVVVAGGTVLQSVKSPTTEDITSGIIAAIRKLQLRDAATISGVMVGTTHFVNAVVQRRNLSRVAAIRIGSPAGATLPPFCDWPADLADLVKGPVWMVEGGHDYDGRRFMPLDLGAIRSIARELRASDIRSVAVTSMFSPLDSSDEETVAALLRDELPDLIVTCSHSLGRIGLLERENATLLNAALVELAAETTRGFERAIAQLGLSANLFITQNDGTVVEAERAVALPVLSFASGPTNSMRGAAYLSNLGNAVVADVGGTTTDFGYFQAGFPREANAVVQVGGVRTLFRMPDLISVGIGGGSIVDPDALTFGPLSVGYRLTEEALVFGGNRLTMTDIAVAAGLVELGDKRRVKHLGKAVVDGILTRVKATMEEKIDRMKTEAGDVTLIAVGGGSFLVPEDLEGVAKVIRVEHGSCANAVGAAIAQVSGEVDQVFQGLERVQAISSAKHLANARATEAGAEPESLSVVEVEDIPVAYLPGNALRVRVKVVGDIRSA